MGVEAEVALLSQAARRFAAIYDALAVPLETETAHACFDGHEVFCFLPPFPEAPPIENRTMRPHPGDVMFFYAGANEFACMAEDRLSGGLAPCTSSPSCTERSTSAISGRRASTARSSAG